MRPTSFARFNSPRPRFEANANNINEDSIDCGIKAIACCTSQRWQTLGTTKTFLTVLIFVAIVQGIAEKFISISALQAALELDFDPDVVEWLLMSNGIIQGISAILIAYWGNRIHKITWFCGMLIFEAVTCFIVIIPTLTHNSASEVTIDAHHIDLLCQNRTSESLTVELPHAVTTLILLFLLQTGIAYGFVAFYTLGLTYLDDNSLEHNSPALLGAALAARYWGFQWGLGLSLAVHETSLGWWVGWTVISPTLLILAILIGLFPIRLLNTVVRNAADTIVETATNSSQISLSRSKLLSDISFLSSVKRLIRNKILMFNILATVFVETAVVNFAFHEGSYLQSRFLLPADNSNLLNNEWTSRTATKFLQPLVVALTVLASGLIIAKANPCPRYIISWNIITGSIVCLIFVAYNFIYCHHSTIAGAYGERLTKPFCSHTCSCDEDLRFTPVCPQNAVQTFYSPCHAGCSTDFVVNGQRVFGNCSCGVDTEITLLGEGSMATEGACGYQDCQKYWIIFQVLGIFAAGCLATRYVGKILISLRSVLAQDRALALAFELTLVGLIAYVPGKIGYEAIADSFCQYWSHDKSICYLHDSPQFGNILNFLSGILVLIGVILEFLILSWTKDLVLYGDENTGHRAIILQNLPASGEQGDTAGQQQAEPLLSHIDATPGLHTIQQSQEQYQRNLPVSQANGEDTNTSQAETQRAGAISPVKYSYLQKMPHNHIEELNFRLQSLNENVEIVLTETDPQVPGTTQRTFGSDINPSVGDISDKESDINIRQLESSVSSINGVNSGSATAESIYSSPVSRRDKPGPSRFVGPETDF